ncbi:hypothetical protein HYH03_005201 [Edaphochlamys debaryana]|uniref:ubiquitinyl hydrolase 1 n=1 Tax=Edaphochlamys debaryana TaxID=47281 RepID=A0A835Y8M3_9CHLO|nr:hypothetical protein HYH03_005201 [Edaphochlamys debaryana]|eukprot:KAG2496793.1 hypothetical protein HYH03_005201 [Edaphochlamys debaryana]
MDDEMEDAVDVSTVNPPLLHCIFGFPTAGPSQLQSQERVRDLVALLGGFVSTLEDESSGAAGEPVWAGLEPSDLEAIASAAGLAHSAVTWFPEFGAALLALDPGPGTIRSDPNTLALHLVCLDCWVLFAPGSRHQASRPSAPERVYHSAASAGHQLLPCGHVSKADHDRLLELIDNRQKWGGGGARTPAFIHAAVEAAVTMLKKGGKEVEAAAAPGSRGGFTNVGQQAGVNAVRDTCWPLVRLVLQVLLERAPNCAPASPPALLLQSALAHMELWLLQGQLRALTPSKADPKAVTDLVHMLQSAARKAMALARKGQDVRAFTASLASARACIEEAMAQRMLQQAQEAEMPAPGSPSLAGRAARPTGVVPEALEPRADEGGLEAARARAGPNLGSVRLLHPGASFTSMLTLLTSERQWSSQADGEHYQLVLRSLERELFGRAAAGFEAPANSLSEVSVAALERVVDAYRLMLQHFLATPAAKAAAAEGALQPSELRSRELLVVEYDLVLQYGVALSYKDLRHLALSDRAAVEAAQAVAAYLQRRTRAGSELFCLRDEGAASFDFALEFAEADDDLRQLWREEQADASARRDEHWSVVQCKQEEAKRLRGEQRALKTEEEGLQKNLDAVEARYKAHAASYASVLEARSALLQNKSKQKAVSAELAAAKEAPPPVIQPLPKDRQAGLAWLFWLHTPPLLRALSRASLLAQQMLLPRPLSEELKSQLAVKELPTSLVSHYNGCRNDGRYLRHPSQTAAGTAGAVRLWASAKAPDAKDIGPKVIDAFMSRADGVWHPDDLLPQMVWKGSGAEADKQLGIQGWFNPFGPVPAAEVETFFAATMPAGAEVLQWAVGTPEEPAASRGNLAIERQYRRPCWLDKPGFLAFGALRAYPLRQLCRLSAALRERTLPLAHPAVHVLVRQLLYHIGTLTDGDPPQLLWRTGWDEPNGVLPTLCAELEALAEQLDPTPREHEAVMLLGPLAAYVAAFHQPCRAVARRFAAMTSRVADELEAEIGLHAADEGRVAALLAKQCRWRAMALLCYDTDALAEVDDARAMVRLAALLKLGRVFLPDPALLAKSEVDQLRAQNVVARRIDFFVRCVAQHPDILTAVVAAVLPSRDLGGGLQWSQLPGSSASWEAVGPDGHLYSVNLLNGTVLFDGWPPSRLPKEVTQHALYRRNFGTWSFEVDGGGQAGAACTRSTRRLVNGRRYEFTLGQGDQSLAVTEVDVGRGVRLELLDPGADHACGEWGPELPPRLRQLYSHWLCRARRVLVLRPPDFQQHDVHYVMQYVRRGAVFTFDCRRVPQHLRACHWLDLLSNHEAELTDRLVRLSGSAVRDTVLAKLDSPDLVHSYQPAGRRAGAGARAGAASCQLIFELPRYGLEFELHRSGELVSRDYPGYRLRRSQRLVTTGTDAGYGSERVSYTLPDFKSYLVLERRPSERQLPAAAQQADALVLIPAGPVQSRGGLVAVATGPGSGACLKVHRYEVHGRFGHLRASSVLARLQLAALYAATGTLLPEPASRATGGQMAMTLLRKCWGTRPLTAQEEQQLRSVGRLGGHLAPGLRPLAAELEASASQLSHLFPCQPGDGHSGGSGDGSGYHDPVSRRDADTVYEQAASRTCQGWRLLSARDRLTASEERRVLGVSRSSPAVPEWRRRGLFTPVPAPEGFPVAVNYVADKEAQLASLVQQPQGGAGAGAAQQACPAYPLASLQEMKAEVSANCAAAEAFLLRHVSAVPDDVGYPGAAFRLLLLSGAAPSAGPLDLAAVAWQQEALRTYNPFLSEEAVAGLHEGVLTWLALCVLEDRLGRLEALARAGEEYKVQLVQELFVSRVWDVRAHPQWLVFEAEGQLQIRPQQDAVAAHLMDPANAGAIAQLNMGEGKTPVILPMLALHWADGSRVVRLNFLSTLLDEAYAHLHAHLTASVLGRKLFMLPYHRNLELTAAQDGGLVLVAPEHRLSLLLKRTELGLEAPAEEDIEVEDEEEAERQAAALCCSALDELTELPYVDVLDESDELLHHRVLEAPAGQPSGTQPALPPPGSFCGLRLLHGEALSAEASRELARELVRELIEQPDLQLHWLHGHPRRDAIVSCMLDAALPAMDLLGLGSVGGGADQLPPDRMPQVLAFRGLLAFKLLEHALQKRHLVDYGVDRSSAQQPRPGGRTRMAVPFRAAHVPSERSEFAQPDVALLLTHKSYYQDGLSLDELQAALAKLLALGPSARRHEYEERWLPLARDGIAPEHLPLLDSAAKLDPGDSTQLQLLNRYFSHNTAAINFWLAHCVLPSETRQFPQRLAASAWHLAGSGGGRVVGFSGTNDNHRLLPLQVHKAEPKEPSLAATNGRMLAVMLNHTLGFKTLPAETGGLPAWRALLDAALALQREGVEVRALIDCGALLAGTSNRAAAAFILPRLDRVRFCGVTYFDEGKRCWVVEDRQGRRAPRDASPFPEADTFVLFDDARCRGADLKLRLGAVGLLTLGPGSTKDRVMQAAGRLRQLGRGQKLWLAAAPDVAARIRSASAAVAASAAAAAANSVDSWPRRQVAEAVLRWAMDNTVAATLVGVQAWADQGLAFAATGGSPRPTDKLTEPALAAKHTGADDAGENAPAGAAAVQQYAAQIVLRSTEYGEGHLVVAGGRADEECEKELEQEEEEEEEVERELPRITRRSEKAWDLAAVSAALAGNAAVLSPASLAAAANVQVRSLPSAVQHMLAPRALRHIPWSVKVHGTSNFYAAAADPQPSPLNDYLRPVDALLLFPRLGQVLLLSEREADQLLGALWERRRQGDAAGGGAGSGRSNAGAPLLLSLCYLRDAWAAGAVPRLAVSLATGATLGAGAAGQGGAAAVSPMRFLDARALVSLQLFNGEVSFTAGAARQEVRVLMAARREAAEALVEMRGKGVALPRSDLERAVEGAQEAA